MNKVLIIDDDKELCALIKRSVLSEDIEAVFEIARLMQGCCKVNARLE